MIVVGTTVAPWKCNGLSDMAWLHHAEEMRSSHGHDFDVKFFAAIEQDARGDDPYLSLLFRLSVLQGEVWRFRIDDGSDEINSGNRLKRICAGRNLVHDYAMEQGASHILFIDSDTEVPGDSIEKLLELDWPIVGGHVPEYCLDGPLAQHAVNRDWTGIDVREHWNTAGFLLVARELFSKLRWRVDADRGMTDDPCFAADARARGLPTFVRHDVIGRHTEWLVPVEERVADKKVYR